MKNCNRASRSVKKGQMSDEQKERGNVLADIPSRFLSLESNELLSKTKFFNDGTVSCDIAILQVVEQATTLSNQHS